ncbi:hypothetical protein Esti_005089 [Eimeria stiedai]
MALFQGPLARAANRFGQIKKGTTLFSEIKQDFIYRTFLPINNCGNILDSLSRPNGLRCLSILHSRNRPARLRVRGLPFSATKEEVARFFAGFELADPHQSAVVFLRLPDGRPSGQALVFFADAEEALKAQRERHMKFLGSRFLELLVDFEVGGGAQRWIDRRPLSENINRKRFIGDNR